MPCVLLTKLLTNVVCLSEIFPCTGWPTTPHWDSRRWSDWSLYSTKWIWTTGKRSAIMLAKTSSLRSWNNVGSTWKTTSSWCPCQDSKELIWSPVGALSRYLVSIGEDFTLDASFVRVLFIHLCARTWGLHMHDVCIELHHSIFTEVFDAPLLPTKPSSVYPQPSGL